MENQITLSEYELSMIISTAFDKGCLAYSEITDRMNLGVTTKFLHGRKQQAVNETIEIFNQTKTA